MRNNECPRVTRTDSLDEAAVRLLDRLAHVASQGAGKVKARVGYSFETFMKQIPLLLMGSQIPRKVRTGSCRWRSC